jgi:hypothetical protein
LSPPSKYNNLTHKSLACNLGYIYGNLTAILTSTDTTYILVVSSRDAISLYTC